MGRTVNPRQRITQSSGDTSMRFVPLSRGKVAIVDACDYEEISSFRWFASWNRNTKSFYAKRNSTIDGKPCMVAMHNQILGIPVGSKQQQGDHALHDTLDNRRIVNGKVNLRIANTSEQAQNRGRRSDNTSGFKGVHLHRQSGKWRARITTNGRSRSLGMFSTAEEAAMAYRAAAEVQHRGFARYE